MLKREDCQTLGHNTGFVALMVDKISAVITVKSTRSGSAYSNVKIHVCFASVYVFCEGTVS